MTQYYGPPSPLLPERLVRAGAAAQEHSEAVAKLLTEEPGSDQEQFGIAKVLLAGDLLDRELRAAFDAGATVDQLIEVTGLHPRYVEELQRAAELPRPWRTVEE